MTAIPIPDDMLGKPEPVRKPGDFKRKGEDGPPYVKSLTKTRQPTGKKDELIEQCVARGIDVPDKVTVAQLKELLGVEPAWEMYGRPSGYGELIDDSWNLIKWKERQVALGIAMQPDVLHELDGADDEQTERAALDRIAKTAHDVAGSMVAADRGTWVHALTEAAEAGTYANVTAPDERFGIDRRHIVDIADGWLQLLADNGLEVLASEFKVVNDDLRLAGTLDRVVRLTKPLTFGEVAIPAGTVLVLDIKTSKLHSDDDGLPSYWDSYPIQIAAYASSVPYVISDDHIDERRATWEEVL